MTGSGYLAKPEFARLWAAARVAWERNGGLRGHARVDELTEDEAFALEGLLTWLRRRPRAGASARAPLDKLDERLRDSGLAPSLQAVLEQMGGPLADRPALRAAQAAAWQTLWEQAATHPAAIRPEVAAWLDTVRQSGLLKRAAPGREAETLRACLDVLATLPRDGVELSRLASEVLGDPHALDYDTGLGGLVASALASARGRERPRNAAAWRAEWAGVGVLCDALSCNVLVLGVRPVGDSPVAQALRLLADAGEPALLTLRQLNRELLRFPPMTVFVCENPAVVSAAAEHHGAGSRPLVCGGGWPNTAVSSLLTLLSGSGCELRYQGDFDDEGTRIADHIARQHGARPWRFDAVTYLTGAGRREGGPALPDGAGTLTLAGARRSQRIAVYEEDVLDRLLEDLG